MLRAQRLVRSHGREWNCRVDRDFFGLSQLTLFWRACFLPITFDVRSGLTMLPDAPVFGCLAGIFLFQLTCLLPLASKVPELPSLKYSYGG